MIFVLQSERTSQLLSATTTKDDDDDDEDSDDKRKTTTATRHFRDVGYVTVEASSPSFLCNYDDVTSWRVRQLQPGNTQSPGPRNDDDDDDEGRPMTGSNPPVDTLVYEATTTM